MLNHVKGSETSTFFLVTQAPSSRHADALPSAPRRSSPPAPAAMSRARSGSGREPPPAVSPRPGPSSGSRARSSSRRSLSPAGRGGDAAGRGQSNPEYSITLPTYTLLPSERDYSEVTKRHSQMTVSQDFMRMVPSWQYQRSWGSLPDSLGCRVVPLDHPVEFDHEQELLAPAVEAVGTEGATPTATAVCPGGKRWSAKVILVQGLDAQAREEVLRGQHNGGQTLTKALR